MKLIDEKGRLFGKINVIDFLVILFLISLTPMIYYGYKIFNAPPPPPPPPPLSSPLQDYQTNIQTFILFKNLPENIAKDIKAGDKELDKDGRAIAEIISVEKIEPNILLVGGGQAAQIVDNTKRQVLVKMLINATVTTNNQILFKNEAISDNKLIKFKPDKYIIEGVIVPPPESKETIYYETDMVFRDIPEKTVKLIKVGDKEMDHNNMVVAEIIGIENIEDENYQIEYSISGVKQTEVLKGSDKKRVKVRMRILVEPQLDNSIVFKGRKIDFERPSPFYFKPVVSEANLTNKYSIKGMIFAPPPPPPPPPPPQKQVVIKIRIDNAIPEIYRFIKAGDVMKIPKVIAENTEVPVSNPQKEKKYIKIAEIKRIVSMENVKREFYSLKRDELIQFDHPYLKNIILEIAVLCYENDGQYIFNGRPARLGSPFTFQNESYEINGTVLDILKKHL